MMISECKGGIHVFRFLRQVKRGVYSTECEHYLRSEIYDIFYCEGCLRNEPVFVSSEWGEGPIKVDEHHCDEAEAELAAA